LTDPKAKRSTELSKSLFDEVLTPLAVSRRDARLTPYFPAWRETKLKSYFTRPTVGRMSQADFEFPGGGTPSGLMDALARFWKTENEPELAAMKPRLEAVARALQEEAAAESGDVDIFCYTLF
jgi:hypothetical protein